MNVSTNEKDDTEIKNFENLKYKITDNNDILLDDSCDPDINFFNGKFQSFDTPYLMPEEFHNFHSNLLNQFSILHLNIRSIKNFFENFKLFLNSINFTFSVICLSETWWDDLATTLKSLCKLPSYKINHQARGDRKGGGVSIYVRKSLDFKIRPYLSINNVDIESLTIEILSDNKRNTLVNALYRPPNGQIEPFVFLNNIFSKIKTSNKLFHIAGDFNLNLLDHDTNTKVQIFLNLVYRNGMIPTINKPTRITRKTATAIDHILKNSFCDTVFKTAIYKCDVSDNFPICFIIPSPLKQENFTETTFITKRIFNTESIELFKQKLYETSCDEMEMSQNPDQAYKTFLTKFSDLYNIYFPTKIIKVKNKYLNSTWITKGIKKSSKRKQRLYEKFFKNCTEKHELAYKTYKRLFESIKNIPKNYTFLILF